MAAYRYPVLVWEDYEGGFTAALAWGADASGAAAVGDSVTGALAQLREYLEWQAEKIEWLPDPDFREPRLRHVTVPVRPGYMEDERVYASPETVAVRVACVHGCSEAGLRLASLPMLGVQFNFFEEGALDNLVAHYAQEALRGLTPQALSRHLPPKTALLEEIVLTVRGAEAKETAAPVSPALSAVAEPLGAPRVRKRYSPAWEREAETADLVRRMGDERTNVIIVGETSAGKSSLLAEAVRRIERAARDAADEDGPARQRHQFWMTNAARLIAGMKYLGQWEERCEELIAALSEFGGVLCVENLLDLMRIGGRGPGDSLAAFFTPYLQRGELRLAGEATPAELDACRRLLPGFADLFQVLALAPLDRRRSVNILARLAETHARNFKIAAERAVPELVYRLHRRFLPYQAMPGPAANFLARLFERKRRERAVGVAPDDVLKQFIAQTGLPERFVRDDLALERETVLETFRAQVIDQDAACQAAADVVMTFKAGLNDPHRPVGVLLFCGPTGVGKTELAKAVAHYLFEQGEQRDRLVRLDMSEYSGLGAAERLLGFTSAEPSEFIRRARQQPFMVVLFDEIEKAAPDVFDVLLALLDEGRLVDRFGRVTNFRSAIVIMTSNLGAQRPASFGFGKPDLTRYDTEAQSFFRPEFYNRLDAVVTFQPLRRETVGRIVVKELIALARREGLKRAGLRLAWNDRVVSLLIEKGFDERYGARLLQRTLETLVITPLARFLLAHRGLRGREIRLECDAQGTLHIYESGPAGT